MLGTVYVVAELTVEREEVELLALVTVLSKVHDPLVLLVDFHLSHEEAVLVSFGYFGRHGAKIWGSQR